MRQRPWTQLWDRLTVRGLVLSGLPIVGLLMLLTAFDVAGQVMLWENAHWTVAGLLSTAVVVIGARTTHGLDRRLRMLVALGTVSWSVGQLCWIIQTSVGFFNIPAPSDIGFLGLVVPVAIALLVAVHGRLRRAEEVAVYLDSAVIFLAITAAILAAYGDGLVPLGLLTETVTLAYPILHLATAGAGLAVLLAIRGAFRAGGGYLLLAGFAMLGLAWVAWLRDAVVALPPAGSLINYFFSVGIIVVGLGGARPGGSTPPPEPDHGVRRRPSLAHCRWSRCSGARR